jgi:hypothetical protein
MKVNVTELHSRPLKINFNKPLLKLNVPCLFYTNEPMKIPKTNALRLHSASCRNLQLKHGETKFEAK